MNEDRRPAGVTLYFRVALVLVVALFAAAYANSWRNGFHFDDSHVVVSNRALATLDNAPRYFTDARTFSTLPSNQNYRPFVSLTFAIDQRVARAFTSGPLDPRIYHLDQLLWLAIASALLGLVALELFRRVAPEHPEHGDWSVGAAIMVAALFALHRGNSEVGNYISARSESLSAAGLLGALLLYLRGGVWRQRYLYLLPMIFGAMSKTPAVLFAPLLLCWQILIEEDLSPASLRTPEGRDALRRAVLSSVPAFVAAIAAYLFVEGMSPARQNYGGGALVPYAFTQTWVWLRYIALFFLPVSLSADSDWRLLDSAFDLRVLAGLAILIASIYAAWQSSKRRDTRPIAFGLTWFWIGLVPATVVPLAEVTNDHRPFLAYMGLSIAVVWAAALVVRQLVVRRLASREIATRLAVVAAAAILIANAIGVHDRNRVWATEATLWADVVRVSPGNARGLMNYGLTAMSAGRYAEARVMFDSAAHLAPAYQLVYVNRAIAADAQGDSASADADFRRAIALRRDDADAQRYFARFLATHGRGPEALAHYALAANARPADIDARHEQLLLMVASGNADAARTEATDLLRLDAADSIATAIVAGHATVHPANGAAISGMPETQRWYLSGAALTRVGRHAEAIQAYREAIAADPTNTDALNNLGWSLGRLGFFAQAKEPLTRAESMAPANALVRNNLAWVESRAAMTAPTVTVAGGQR